jgi:HK97 family phage major capsid protein
MVDIYGFSRREGAERRATLADEMQAILDGAPSRALTPQERTKFDALDENVKDLTAKIAEFDKHFPPFKGEYDSLRMIQLEGAIDLGAKLRAFGPYTRTYDREAPIASAGDRRNLGSLLVAAGSGDAQGLSLDQRAALATNPGSVGGFLLNDGGHGALLDAMRAASATASAGAQTLIVEGRNPSLVIPVVTSPLAASWVAEGAAASESSIALESVSLRARKITAIIRVSRELLSFGSGVEDLLLDQLAKAVAEQVDAAAITGNGQGEIPLGLLASKSIYTKTLTAAPALADFLDVYYAVLAHNADPTKLAVVGNSDFFGAMDALQATTNEYLSGTGGAPRSWNEVRKVVSNVIPTTGGKTSAIIGDFSRMVVAAFLQPQIKTSEAAVVAGQSAFERGQVAFGITGFFDTAVLDPSAFGIIKDATIA